MSSATDANAGTTVLVPGYDPAGHQDRVAFKVVNVATDNTVSPAITYGDLNVGGTVTANNSSIGTLESPIPSSATLMGANDGAGNLDELMLESDANPNLRVAVFNGANEFFVDTNGSIIVQLRVASGTALVADQSNTELRTSLYVKKTTAGDTALSLGQATMANSVPVAIASDQGVLSTQTQTQTTGGSTPSHTISAASTNSTNIKASAGQIYDGAISNTNAAARFLKLYDKATAPTVGTDTPKRTIQIPANSTVILSWPNGLSFANGIGFGTTTGIADADTGAIGANDLSIDLGYK
jgi:hypothetical protein